MLVDKLTSAQELRVPSEGVRVASRLAAVRRSYKGVVRAALPISLGIFVTYAVLHAGLPALRHDWRVPYQRDAEVAMLRTLIDGWLPNGIGSAQPYPTFYFVGFALWPFQYIVDSTSLMAIVLCSSVALAAAAAGQIVADRGGDRWLQAAVMVIVTLNPWVYSKYVAGHILMVFAYATLLALIAETGRKRPRRWVLLILCAFSITQIEYFVIIILPLALWLVRRRQWSALLVSVLAVAAIVFGIAASFSDIRNTPFSLVWQRSQSLAPLSALVLQGYATGYASAFAPLAFVGVMLVSSTAIAAVRSRRSNRSRAYAAAAVVLALFSMGTKSFAGGVYTWLVLHVPAIGLFRELYDLVGLIIIAYVVVLAEGLSRYRYVGAVLAVIVSLWALPWVMVPPATFFVVASTIPAAIDPASSAGRVAYLPAFQPLTYDGRGSGVDPDAYVRTGRAIPLNEFFPQYPVDSALAYLERGDERFARALGVVTVISRPYLQSNYGALRYQWVGIPHSGEHRNRRGGRILPLLGYVEGAPRTVSLGDSPDDFSVFFADRDPQRIARFAPSLATNAANVAWVDERLAVPIRPELGSPFNGVTTTSSEPLHLQPGHRWNAVLAQTWGRLTDDRGRYVATNGHILRWWALSPNARALRCIGSCTVALVARLPHGLPMHNPLRAMTAVDIHFLTPWFAKATVPATGNGSLRLAVRYNSAWLSIAGRQVLPHFRLATTLNGYSLSRGGTRDVYFIEVVALVQAALELTAVGTLLTLLGREYVMFRKELKNA